jgi:hypothetical protein
MFPPWALAAAGLVVSFAFLFQTSLGTKALMFLCFVAAAFFSGKRVTPVATLLVGAGIVLANLLVPIGRVIGRIGPFMVTETALVEGIGKAITFEGLLYASKACILPSLRLPGRLGSIVAAAFVYYDRIIEYKGSLRAGSIVADADRLMLKVWEEPAASRRTEIRPSYPAAGFVILACLCAAALIPYLPLVPRLLTR